MVKKGGVKVIDLKDIDFYSKAQEIESRKPSDIVDELMDELKLMYTQIKQIEDMDESERRGLLTEVAEGIIRTYPNALGIVDYQTDLLYRSALFIIEHQALLLLVNNKSRVEVVDDLLIEIFQHLETMGSAGPNTLYEQQMKTQYDIVEVLVKNDGQE